MRHSRPYCAPLNCPGYSGRHRPTRTSPVHFPVNPEQQRSAAVLELLGHCDALVEEGQQLLVLRAVPGFKICSASHGLPSWLPPPPAGFGRLNSMPTMPPAAACARAARHERSVKMIVAGPLHQPWVEHLDRDVEPERRAIGVDLKDVRVRDLSGEQVLAADAFEVGEQLRPRCAGGRRDHWWHYNGARGPGRRWRCPIGRIDHVAAQRIQAAVVPAVRYAVVVAGSWRTAVDPSEPGIGWPPKRKTTAAAVAACTV